MGLATGEFAARNGEEGRISFLGLAGVIPKPESFLKVEGEIDLPELRLIFKKHSLFDLANSTSIGLT